MKPGQLVYLNLNGIPSSSPPTDGAAYFSYDPLGSWEVSQGDLSFEVENACIPLYRAFQEAVFGSLTRYYQILPYVPDFILRGGMNSEVPISRDMFEQFLQKFSAMPYINNFLYLADCEKLISGIQECSKEVGLLQGEFYRALNLDQLFYPDVEESDGVRFIASPVVTNITATLNFIFIRLHSLLDYSTKLAFEIDNLPSEFSSYPRLASANVQYGDRKRLNMNGKAGTLFESCALISEVETIRNLVIHDGLLDEMPKVYKRIESGSTVEKFVLMPEMVEGRLAKYKNRKLFYGTEDKINLRLPELLSAFQARLTATLKGLLEKLQQRAAAL